jgi:3,4-dihydroxy 2-butanone 4-phosphate synthase/GTP cyclohydrolase II
VDTVRANELLGFPADRRDYRCAACLLKKLNVKSVSLLTNNPSKISQMELYGIPVNRRIPLQVKPNRLNLHYLLTKRDMMNHMITLKG